MCRGYIQSEQLKVFIKSNFFFPVAVFQNSSRFFFQPFLVGFFFPAAAEVQNFFFSHVWLDFFSCGSVSLRIFFQPCLAGFFFCTSCWLDFLIFSSRLDGFFFIYDCHGWIFFYFRVVRLDFFFSFCTTPPPWMINGPPLSQQQALF